MVKHIVNQSVEPFDPFLFNIFSPSYMLPGHSYSRIFSFYQLYQAKFSLFLSSSTTKNISIFRSIFFLAKIWTISYFVGFEGRRKRCRGSGCARCGCCCSCCCFWRAPFKLESIVIVTTLTLERLLYFIRSFVYTISSIINYEIVHLKSCSEFFIIILKWIIFS